MLMRLASVTARGAVRVMAAALLLASAVTGVAIGTHGEASGVGAWLPPLVPGADTAMSWHVVTGLAAAAMGLASWTGRRSSRPSYRPPSRKPAGVESRLRARLLLLREQTKGLLYPLLALLAVTGLLLVSGVSVAEPPVAAFLIELHIVTAWAAVGVALLHLAGRYPRTLDVLCGLWEGEARAPADARAPAIAPMRLELDLRDLRALVTAVAACAQRLRMYVGGCACFAFGIKCFIDADLGVDPLHAMTLGIVAWIDRPYVGVGLVDSLATVLLLLVWAAWNRRLPPLTIFITMALVGYLVDLCNALELHLWTTAGLPSALLMVLGLVLVSYGSALIIMSGIGLRVVDLIAVTLMERLGSRFFAAKLALEALFFACAWLLGGPLGLATIGFLIVVGPFMEPMMRANRRFLGLPNHGFPPNQVGQG